MPPEKKSINKNLDLSQGQVKDAFAKQIAKHPWKICTL